MITVTDIRKVKEGQYDVVWAIVRSYKGGSEWIEHVPELAPSFELLRKANTLKNAKMWDVETFNAIYVPAFLKEFRKRETLIKLRELMQLDKQGKSIALVCLCPHEEDCHRCIVAGLLQGAGLNVSVPSGNDYSNYYKMYRKIHHLKPVK